MFKRTWVKKFPLEYGPLLSPWLRHTLYMSIDFKEFRTIFCWKSNLISVSKTSFINYSSEKTPKHKNVFFSVLSITSHVVCQRRLRFDQLLRSNLVVFYCCLHVCITLVALQKTRYTKTNQSEYFHSNSIFALLFVYYHISNTKTTLEYCHRSGNHVVW